MAGTSGTCPWYIPLDLDLDSTLDYDLVGTFILSSCHSLQVAEIGGWLVLHGSLSALDRALDADPCANHKFLEQGERLVQQKIANPGTRISKTNDLCKNENAQVVEEKRQGLRAPKRKFMTVEAYERRHGPVDASKIKTHRVNGQEIRGVDVMAAEDVGVYEYIDESLNSAQRITDLGNEEGITLSDEQNTVIFSAASQALSTTPKEGSCVVLPSSSSSSSDGRGLAAMGGDPATVEPGTPKPSEAPCCYYYSHSHLTTCNYNLLQLLSKYYIAIAIISVMICFYCYLFGLSTFTFTFTVTIQLVENPGMFSYC